MRTILKGGLVLLLLLGGLAGYGLLTPTIEHSFEVTVDRSVIPVFTRLVAVNDMPKWVRSLERVEPIGFNPIPGLPMGSYDLFYSKGLSSRQFRMDVLEVDPINTVKVRMGNDMMELECTATFTPQGDRTLMSLHSLTRGKVLLTRMALPFFIWRLRKETEENIANFKRLVEES